MFLLNKRDKHQKHKSGAEKQVGQVRVENVRLYIDGSTERTTLCVLGQQMDHVLTLIGERIVKINGFVLEGHYMVVERR